MLPLFGIKSLELNITVAQIATTVGIYLGIPFILALISRYTIKKFIGDKWFNQKFIPFVSPITLIALLFTIVIMFSLKGEMIVDLPLDVIRIAIPLVLFFTIMFFLMFFVSKKSGPIIETPLHYRSLHQEIISNWQLRFPLVFLESIAGKHLQELLAH